MRRTGILHLQKSNKRVTKIGLKCVEKRVITGKGKKDIH